MAARLTVKAKPRASKRGVAVKDGVVVVSVTSPPVDGRANDEIVEVIAEHIGVRRADVTIVTGASSKTKIVEVAGLTDDALAARLARE